MEAATLSRPAAGCRTDATDEDLVAATRAGDDRAFELLYGRYQRRIAAYVLGMVKDHQRAEDVTQEVFMSALRRMRQTDRSLAFKPWIYEIAKNACIDQFRRSRRTEEVSYDAEDGGVDRLVCGGPTPDVAADAHEDLDHLRGAFVGLNESHHKILVMRELEGRSYAEIGDRLGMTRPAVESTLFRARKRLAEEYDELVTGERCRRVQTIIATADAGALGARDQRRMARHVSYCQPCRRAAALAGLGEHVPARTGVRAKIAGLLPLPVVLRDRWLGIGSHHASPASDGAGLGTGALAGWLHAAAPMMDAGGSGWMKAMATAATVAVAGAGAGAVVGGNGAGASGGLPDLATRVAAITGGGSGGDQRSAASFGPATSSVSRAATGATGAGAGAASGARPSSGGRGGAASGGLGTATAPSAAGATGAASGAASSAGVPAVDPAGTVGAATVDPASAPSTVTKTADEGRRTAGTSLPSVLPTAPSTTTPPVGDTQAKVPTPPDVTQAPEQTTQQATQQAAGAVGTLTPGLQDTGSDVANALPSGG